MAEKRKRATEAQRIDFVRQYLPYVQKIAKQYNVPAHSILGQWALESDWGTVTTGKNNIFGIKSVDPKSKARVRSQTKEQFTPEQLESWKGKLEGREVIEDLGPIEKGKNEYSVYDYFRSFETPEEATTIKSEFLKRFPKIVGAKDTKGYAEGLLQGTFGPYATDKDYVKNLVKMDSGVLGRIKLINAENAKVENKRSGGIVGNMNMQYKKGGMVNQAKGLASFGRGEDTELIHMTPSEINGLQSLAVRMGGSLATNPTTGLPEAGFFKNILPMLVGGALSLTGVGALGVGAMMGGGALAASGGDLKQAVKWGLGGYSGAGLAGSLAGAGAGVAPGTAATATTAAVPATAAQQATFNAASLGAKQGFVEGARTGLGNIGSALTSTDALGRVAASPLIKRQALSGLGSLVAGNEIDMAKSDREPPKGQQDLSYFPEGGYRYDENNNVVQANPNARNMFNAQGRYDWGAGYPTTNAAQGFADGGLTRGPGDGMSDEIMTSISGQQPAALSPGEFVVPADVVSDMGNGSTTAGARQLYSMMDRVRKARGGSIEQPAAINPNEYMPA